MPTTLVSMLRDDDTAKVLQARRGKGFVRLRDEALIRLYANTGARLSEVDHLLVTDLDMNNVNSLVAQARAPICDVSWPGWERNLHDTALPVRGR
jgi:site-specific recombinase XerD